jgi:hypothetical protein
MEYTLVGLSGIVLLVVIMLSQITRLEHRNALLRQENETLKSRFNSPSQVKPVNHFGCLAIFMLLFLVTLTCISLLGSTPY